jgi:cell wall-associated NlpC family hydrolase
MKVDGGLLLIGAVLYLGYRLGRRRSAPPAYPPAWGAPQQSAGSVKKGALLVLAAAGRIVGLMMAGAEAGKMPKGKRGGPTLGAIFGALPTPKALNIGTPFSNAKPSTKAIEAVRFAMAQRGDRYRLGANGPNVWDCSGLTQGAWRHAGVKIPPTAQTQLKGLARVKHPKRGDLIVYRSKASPTGFHVAIAVGQGQMVEAR